MNPLFETWPFDFPAGPGFLFVFAAFGLVFYLGARIFNTLLVNAAQGG